MLAGGADSLSRMTWGGFHSLLLVDGAGCRPFDANRAGMSLGEGAAVLVLEAEETARRRGATILARLSGWGASCDAHHATAPHPQGAGAAAAMQTALRRAGLEPAAIDYVNAHGTGTRDNDLAEANALKTVFGGRVPRFPAPNGSSGTRWPRAVRLKPCYASRPCGSRKFRRIRVSPRLIPRLVWNRSPRCAARR